jgi:hypothetical protein
MLSRILICSSFLLVLSGCMSNETPMPRIVYTPPAPVVSHLPVKAQEIPMGIGKGWFPPSHLEERGRWKGIVIHHSAFPYGCAAQVDKYHKSLGWKGLGYHFVINNGVFKNGYGKSDGLVEVGYRWGGQKRGSHCRPEDDHTNYWNEHTIGICLIGDFEKTRPTESQWYSLVRLIRFLRGRYKIPTSQIKEHRDIKPTKCPGRRFSMDELNRRLALQR